MAHSIVMDGSGNIYVGGGFDSQNNSNTFSYLGDLPPGFYFLQIRTKQDNITKKLLIIRK